MSTTDEFPELRFSQALTHDYELSQDSARLDSDPSKEGL